MAQSYLDNLLSENEKIIRATRQHWFILASAILLEITLIVVIFAGSITAVVFFPEFPVIIAIIGFIILMIPVATMTRDILVWSNHQFIVTNRRVMQISGVINKNVIDSSLEKVNDVKMEQSAFGRVFGYGNIEILTASELGVNQFMKIDDPVGFKTAMLNAKAQLENGFEPEAPEIDVPAMISKIAQLRQQGILTEEEFQEKKAALLAKM